MSQIDEINQALRQGGRVTVNGSVVKVTGLPIEPPPATVDQTRLGADGQPLPAGSGDGGKGAGSLPPETDVSQALRDVINLRRFGR